jgi:hypothetical protein
VNITHIGWFLLCPVLLADIDSDCPYMETRRFIPGWWFTVNAEVVDFFLFLLDMMGCEVAYPILITGEVASD